MKHPERLVVVALSCAWLVACGDGGDSPAPAPGPTEMVPGSASESSAGLVKYLTDLFAASADTKEPVDLGTFAPKTPDDTEPEPLS